MDLLNKAPENSQTGQTLPQAAKAPRAKPKARKASDRRFDMGLFAYHRGDYAQALREFEKSCEAASVSRDYRRYVESCNYVLRLLAEREEFEKIGRIEGRVLQILASADASQLQPSLKSRALYILGICACYQDTKHDLAMRRFREAIDFAMMAEDKEALAAPLYGAATVQYALQRYDEALKELDRLNVLLTCLHLPDFNSAAHLLRSLIERNKGDLDASLASAWKAFDGLKDHPHLVLYLQTLCALGTVYGQKGDVASARLYLDLADRGMKREEFPRIARLVDDAIKSLGTAGPADIDLHFDVRSGLLIERSKGEIRFEGQFILRDLLRAFLENPGRVFTKEDLAHRVWRESYNPKVHDNKIYVTIKRLRKLLEGDDAKSEYIMRAKNGYFLNPKSRVLIHDPEQTAATSQKDGAHQLPETRQ